MSNVRSNLLDRARLILAAEHIEPGVAFALAKELKQKSEFTPAWRVLERVRHVIDVHSELRVPAHQLAALCTYKDEHLNDAWRLDRALEILGEGEDLAKTTDPETLGLAGAIHKRLWNVRSDVQQLESSLDYYSRGHDADRAIGFKAKQGYPGINAAFVLDMLASLDRRRMKGTGGSGEPGAAMRARAQAIRREIVEGLTPLVDADRVQWGTADWWPVVTLAEALFGQRQFAEAGVWLARARGIPDVPAWELETAARQLTTLARLLDGDAVGTPDEFLESPAGAALKALLGDDAASVATAYLGKIGLALSGGGFRASLYQIGVLARLAELDVLRHVEVLSCVSGGSILGAYYYLELRHLLQQRPDGEIRRDDYIKLVQRVEKGFLAGVQTNVRTRVAAEFLTNLRMIFQPSYSRTQRIGELYERGIYSNVADGNAGWKRWLTDLYVAPKGQPDFDFKRDNWRRRNKVPMLVLNATTLNTGHNWQFTASFMGEPPTTIDPETDSNYRLRRLYYKEAPKAHQRIRLGTAVGASACVPGLFEPIVLKGLYEHPDAEPGKGRPIHVRLVDGGVHDNQGLVGLLEQGCNVVLVGDASGQMETDDDPSKGVIGVPLRSNGILQFRVRGAQFKGLASRLSAGLLRSVMVVHLKLDLDAEPVDWIDCDEPKQASEAARPRSRRGSFTFYGIRKTVQNRLAAIRTDLDSFSEAEAWSLMYSGYRATDSVFPNTVEGFPPAAATEPEVNWRFFRIAPILEEAKGDAAILKILDVGSKAALKVWLLSKPLKVIGWIVLGVAIVAGAWAAWTWRDFALLTVRDIGILVLGAIGAVLVGKLAMKIVRFRETISKVLIGVAMSLFGFLLARMHLWVFDPIFLRLGRVDRLK